MKLLKLFGLTFLLITGSGALFGMEDEIAALQKQIDQTKNEVRKAALRKKLETLKAEAARRPAKVKPAKVKPIKEEKEKEKEEAPQRPVGASVHELAEQVADLLEQVKAVANEDMLNMFHRALGSTDKYKID